MWAFLDHIAEHRIRPWLILEERQSPIGGVPLAVPRLVPEAGWKDSTAYGAWVEATWRDETTPIPAVVTVEQAARTLPASPTKPRWRNSERLVSVAIRADLEGMSAATIMRADGEASLAGDRARGVRKEIENARRFLAALGALPWAAFPAGRLPPRSTDWWRTTAFARGLANWRRDAARLSWRYAREPNADVDRTRQAAHMMLRAPWVPPVERAAVLAEALLKASAQDFEGTCDDWLEQFIAFPHQTPKCRRDLVQMADGNGSTDQLRAIWAAARPNRSDSAVRRRVNDAPSLGA
jgi:hypothetical protein